MELHAKSIMGILGLIIFLMGLSLSVSEEVGRSFSTVLVGSFLEKYEMQSSTKNMMQVVDSTITMTKYGILLFVLVINIKICIPTLM